MKSRIENIKNLRGALASLNLSYNPDLWFREFLKSPNETTMKEIEDYDKEFSKKVELKESYDQMVKDIYDEMYRVFGTKNDASAAAFAATWEAMANRPDNYVDSDLGFTDATAVLAYANAQIAKADAYGVFRLKKIAAYQALLNV